jgi:hypothetical protein
MTQKVLQRLLFAHVEVLWSFLLAMFSSSFIYGFIMVLDFYSINLLIMLLRSFKNLSHVSVVVSVANTRILFFVTHSGCCLLMLA